MNELSFQKSKREQDFDALGTRFERKPDGFEIGLRPEPDNTVNRIALAYKQLEAGSFEDALESFAKLVVFVPDAIGLCFAKAVAELNLGRIDEARASLNLLLSRSPDNAQAKEILDKLSEMHAGDARSSSSKQIEATNTFSERTLSINVSSCAVDDTVSEEINISSEQEFIQFVVRYLGISPRPEEIILFTLISSLEDGASLLQLEPLTELQHLSILLACSGSRRIIRTMFHDVRSSERFLQTARNLRLEKHVKSLSSSEIWNPDFELTRSMLLLLPRNANYTFELESRLKQAHLNSYGIIATFDFGISSEGIQNLEKRLNFDTVGALRVAQFT